MISITGRADDIIVLNPDHIVSIYGDDGALTTVETVGEDWYTSMTPEEIEQLIEDYRLEWVKKAAQEQCKAQMAAMAAASPYHYHNHTVGK